MIVEVNGQPRDLPDDATVQTVVDALDGRHGARGIAVAVDAEVVPRDEWSRRRVAEGARVEVVAAIQGG